MCEIDGMTNLEAIGKRIAALRRQAGMTQDALAAEIGVARPTLAGIERGLDRAGIVSTIAIADYFKVPMDWLLGRSVPPGGPLTTQIIDRHDELIWVEFWRGLPVEERPVALRLLGVKRSNDAVA
jgi:transcriptional regulator with XRE-family HTH domain